MVARDKTKFKRLELWLPVDHPLFDYPPGQRATRAKELLDTALRLEERLAGIEKQLAEIAENRGNEGTVNIGQVRKNTVSFDIEAFMNL